MAANVPTMTSTTSGAPASLFRRVFLLSVLFAIFATACGTGSSTESTASAPVAGTPGANAFLEGEFDTFGGPSINLAEVQNKDVVLWFWAPW